MLVCETVALWSMRIRLWEKAEVYFAWPQANLFTKPSVHQLYNGTGVCSGRFGACI